MGIGAYQVREFIQGIGGQLNVSSELNIGTTVCIELPISEASSQPRPHKDKGNGKGKGKEATPDSDAEQQAINKQHPASCHQKVMEK